MAKGRKRKEVLEYESEWCADGSIFSFNIVTRRIKTVFLANTTEHIAAMTNKKNVPNYPPASNNLQTVEILTVARLNSRNILDISINGIMRRQSTLRRIRARKSDLSIEIQRPVITIRTLNQAGEDHR